MSASVTTSLRVSAGAGPRRRAAASSLQQSSTSTYKVVRKVSGSIARVRPSRMWLHLSWYGLGHLPCQNPAEKTHTKRFNPRPSERRRMTTDPSSRPDTRFAERLVPPVRLPRYYASTRSGAGEGDGRLGPAPQGGARAAPD